MIELPRVWQSRHLGPVRPAPLAQPGVEVRGLLNSGESPGDVHVESEKSDAGATKRCFPLVQYRREQERWIDCA